MQSVEHFNPAHWLISHLRNQRIIAYDYQEFFLDRSMLPSHNLVRQLTYIINQLFNI